MSPAGTPASSGAGAMAAHGGETGSAGMGSTAGAGASGDAAPRTAGTSGATVTCPSPALKAGDTTKMLQVGSSTRSYVLHVPPKYTGSAAVPLVVDFHPLGGSGPQEKQGSPYLAPTEADGAIMAFPSGLAGPSGGAWNVGPCCVANVDDVAFARALVADVQKSACIDPARIYAVGFSMGGGFSHYLACHAADLFAAVAPAAFDLLEENVPDCKPARPISVISFRGSSDPVVKYTGGPSAVVSGMPITFLGAMGTFQKWAELNHCTGAPSAADSDNCQIYSSCAAGTEVMLCTKQGGGHEPGNAKIGWPALKRHTLP